jgi:rhodanese-related sulfurtransferase
VISFGLFDGTLGKLRKAQTRLGREAQVDCVGPHVEQILLDGAYEGVEEVGFWCGRTTVEQLLADARARLHRLSPEDATAAMRAGALLIDIRSEVQRERDGIVPASRHVARNVFEWRCDPSSDWHDPEITDQLDRKLIVICNEGYQSSLAAATLQRVGFTDATDVIGGFQAWVADSKCTSHQPAGKHQYPANQGPGDTPSQARICGSAVSLDRNSERDCTLLLGNNSRAGELRA